MPDEGALAVAPPEAAEPVVEESQAAPAQVSAPAPTQFSDPRFDAMAAELAQVKGQNQRIQDSLVEAAITAEKDPGKKQLLKAGYEQWKKDRQLAELESKLQRDAAFITTTSRRLLAEQVAREEGFTITDAQWKAINRFDEDAAEDMVEFLREQGQLVGKASRRARPGITEERVDSSSGGAPPQTRESILAMSRGGGPLAGKIAERNALLRQHGYAVPGE